MDPTKFIFPAWVHWIAQDADGAVWGYEVEPLQHHQGWYENEVGRSQKLEQLACTQRWQQTLTKT